MVTSENCRIRSGTTLIGLLPTAGNVEFGVLIDNANLTEAAERELRRAEELLFEAVTGGS